MAASADVRGTRRAELDLPGAAATSDLEVHRTAHLWLEGHGTQAVAEARGRVRALRHADVAGADTWLRLIVALEEMTLWQGRLSATLPRSTWRETRA